MRTARDVEFPAAPAERIAQDLNGVCVAGCAFVATLARQDDTDGSEMPATPLTAANRLTKEFDAPWRDDTPVFGCCRKTVQTAVDNLDVLEIVTQDATTRVRALRDAAEADNPGHLAAHRCCAGHLADLAFDLPDLVAPVEGD
jgi:hypothetical protein